MELIQPSDESRVLVIYTGGTIGMLVGPQGYRNEPHFLTETLRSQSRFHDPLGDSLFSHSSSVEGFRRWTSSGRTTPEGDGPSQSQAAEVPTLPVKAARPVLSSLLSPEIPGQRPTVKSILSTKLSENVYECHLPSLVTPKTSMRAGNTKRIRYTILEWDPLLDSSNVETDDWVRMATEIELNYASFDAFVILHGTDTMCYTSSALSFLLEDLGKTVIITGAQIPLSQLRNDAVDNFLGALTIAGYYIIPECCIFFNHYLYRGNRVSKTSAFDLDAFTSPNFPCLVNVGIDIVVNWENVIRQTSLRRFKAHKTMDSRVATLRLFPGITAEIVRTFLRPPIQGVVLETFGSGNAPQRSDLMAALQEASQRGVVIVAITQCSKGSVSDAYETGRSLLRAGVVPGGDMTPECALTKLGYLLSKGFSVTKVRELMGLPIRGELTAPTPPTPLPSLTRNFDTMQQLLVELVRLSSSTSSPEILVSPAREHSTDDAAAPWSWTAAEANVTEASLLPFLIHLAVSRDDPDALAFCTTFHDRSKLVRSPSEGNSENYAGGIVNNVDQTSGRSLLHTAALNGSIRCLPLLLESGALVHLRDSLGHTALYYAARSGHLEIVKILRQAGANLGGSDIEGGFAEFELDKAIQRHDSAVVQIWSDAGIYSSKATLYQKK